MKAKSAETERKFRLYGERQEAFRNFWRINTHFEEVQARNKKAAQEAQRRENEAELAAQLELKKTRDQERHRLSLQRRKEGAMRKIHSARSILDTGKRRGTQALNRQQSEAL